MKTPVHNDERKDARALLDLAHSLHVIVSRLTRRLRSEGSSGDLTSSQKAVLSHLDGFGSATVSSLAYAEGVRPQSMGATIAALQAMDLVQSRPDPADGRRTLLSVTPKCRAMIDAGRAARNDWLVRALGSRFTASERDQLARAVTLLSRLVE